MKKNIFRTIKLTSTLLICQLTITPNVFALDVSINGSENLTLINTIQYNYQNAQPSIEFDIVEPFVCTFANPDTSAPITLEVNNGDLLSGNAITQANYNIANNLFEVNTNANIQCASEQGVYSDLLYTGGFEAVGTSIDFNITLLDKNSNPFVNPEIADNQIVEYKYIVTNNGKSATVDILENYLGSGTTFVNVDANPDWICVSSHAPVNCGSGNGLVTVENRNMQANETITITAIRKASVPQVGAVYKLDLLAAVFVKNKSEINTVNNTVLQAFSSANNTPPSITLSTISAFAEDTQSDVVNFTVDDVNMDNNDIVVTATSSNTSIVPNGAGNIIVAGSGNDRTIQIIPAANANTETSSITITVAAFDGIATTTTDVVLTINPINDIPSFEFSCIDNIVDSQTGIISCNDISTNAINIANFITNINLGNSFDNSAQSVNDYIVSIGTGGDPDGIIHADIGGSSVSIDPVTHALIFSLVNGNYGTAAIKVQMQDNAGTANGGVDTSVEQEFTITVPIPEYVFTASVINLPTFENFSLRLVDTTNSGNTTVALTQVTDNGTTVIGQLPLASDYKVYIDGTTGGASNCTIAGADGNGELHGSNISDHLTIDIDCQ